MASPYVCESPIELPTLGRARELVPPEFSPCYDWFQQHTNRMIPRLPHNMSPAPDTPIPLSRLSGIYSPSTSRVTYCRGRRYALSVHAGNRKKYSDRDVILLPDGTWLFDYAEYVGDNTDQNYNETLKNCLEDGIPVGVMIREVGGYRVLGLAYVERYNGRTHMFTLHGPITAATESAGSFFPQGFDDLTADDRGLLLEYDGADERRAVATYGIRREQQGRFRSALIDAYGGSCAITGVNVIEALQAAHIYPYRGKKTQVVNNGILLRADLHLLYDENLLSIEPDTLSVQISSRLKNTTYAQYSKRTLRIPEQASLAPSRELLAVRYREFRLQNPDLVA